MGGLIARPREGQAQEGFPVHSPRGQISQINHANARPKRRSLSACCGPCPVAQRYTLAHSGPPRLRGEAEKSAHAASPNKTEASADDSSLESLQRLGRIAASCQSGPTSF